MNGAPRKHDARWTRRGATKLIPLATFVAVAAVGIAMTRNNQTLGAQDTAPTFTKDVAPIVYKNCASCHRPGGLGPFSLLDYDSAKANIDDMRDAVRDRVMPPWHAE
ncbi:MAG: cytochrome c, partial [Gemmatimonadaceae bacterium]